MFGFFRNVGKGYRDAEKDIGVVGSVSYDELKRILSLDESDPDRRSYDVARGTLNERDIPVGQDIGRGVYRMTHRKEAADADHTIATTEPAATLDNAGFFDMYGPLGLPPGIFEIVFVKTE